MSQNAESNLSSTPIEPVSKPAAFTWKHAAALFLAVGITAGVIIFQKNIEQLQELGYVGIFLIMFITSATLILPAPGLLFVFLLGKSFDPLLLGLAAGAGSTFGEISGYMAGYSGSGVIENLKVYQRIEGWVKKYGVIPIVILAAIPNPLFDAAGLAAGVLGMVWWQFFSATLVGKTIKTVAVAYAGFYGVGWVESLIAK